MVVWIALVLLGGVLAVLLDGPPAGPFDRDDAIRCGTTVADRLGYEVTTPTAEERNGSWDVAAAGDGLVMSLTVRIADERITEVAVLRGGFADVLTREERLVVLEGGC